MYIPNMLQLLKVAQGYESSIDFYACSNVRFSRRHSGSNIHETQYSTVLVIYSEAVVSLIV